MAPSVYIFLALVGEFTLLLSAAKVQLKCQHENLGISSQNSIINCSVKAAEASDANIIVVLWKKDESTVLMYYEKIITNEQRFKFAEPNWDTRNMNVSLLVMDTKIADEGQYQCHVITDSGETKEDTSLKVNVKYSKPVMNSIPEKDIQENMRVEIFCNASGGFPAGVIHWYGQDGTNWTQFAKTDVMQTKDKLFSLTSSLTVSQASSSSLGYSCVVLSSNGVQEGMADYNLSFALDDDPEKTHQEAERHSLTLTAVLVVVGSLACGLLIIMLIRRSSLCHHQRNPGASAGFYLQGSVVR